MGHAEPDPGSPNGQNVPDEISLGPTPHEEQIEKTLVRKIDLHILPIVVLLYLFSFLDRVNIGNARLYGLEEDLGLVGNQYQVSVSILFVTYCFFEVPSNLVLKKLRPSRYIATISVMWGIIATLTGITQNYGGLIACRILLGVVEAGLFPGFITYLTLFYSKREIALRTSYLFSSAAIAGAFGGLLAYGIGFMDGICGLRGWRWIMIIEGIPTVLLGVVTWFILADDPDTAYYLNKEERALVALRRSRYIGQTESAQKFHWADVKEGVLDWKIWAFSFGQFGIDTMLYGYSTFLPTIIKGMGNWTTAEVQALTIPCYGLGAIAYLGVAWLSDRTQHRAFFICLFCAISVVGYGILISDSSSGVHYFGALMVALGLYVAVGLPLAWLPTNLPRYAKRTYATGLQLTFGNISGVMSPFLYPNSEGPRFVRGNAVTLGMVAFAGLVYGFMWISYRFINKRRAQGLEDEKISSLSEQDIQEMGDRNPRFLYSI
ncbi:Sucrose/H+ symporter, plant [Penicillium camemberti]|uniref:Sucrose/H+ symporter, plant n=1 Tax=Penicillium camemberti (strain FM 013) TaxID=1429867 RepID=A0A0G4PY83_PENC3|nr:Sucrose/H+ symporter, plant [Penicillium camemberti]